MDNGWVPTRKNQDFLLSVLLQTELLNYDIVSCWASDKLWFLVHRKWNSFDTKSCIFYPWIPFRDKNNNNDYADDDDDDDDDDADDDEDDDDDADADYGDNKIENDNEEGGGNPRWSNISSRRKHVTTSCYTISFIIHELFDWLLHMIYWRTGASKASKFISILDSMLPSACTVIDH